MEQKNKSRTLSPLASCETLPITERATITNGHATGSQPWPSSSSPIVRRSPMNDTVAQPTDDDEDLPIVILPDEAPTLVDYDRRAERATFSIAACTYVVEVPYEADTTQLSVTVRHDGQVYADVFSMAVSAACQRFAGNAALRCGIPADVISTHLPRLWSAVQELRVQDDSGEDDNAPNLEPTGAEREDALVRLRSPNLLNSIVVDCATLGWVGEDDAKRISVLTAISRKLPTPLWAVRTMGGTHTREPVNMLALMTPPEDIVHVSRLSHAALSYQDTHALCHKLILIDDAATLPKDALLALQLLRSRGALSQAVVPRHNLSGSARALVTEVRGPIALVAVSSGNKRHQLGAECCHIPADTSPMHLTAVAAAECAQYATLSRQRDAEHAVVVTRLHHLQRLLHRLPVVIPFAQRIQFPPTLMRQPGVQTRFLGLIAASALLHQYQRLRHDGHLVADERDFHIAVSLVSLLTAPESSPLGVPATELWTALQHAGMQAFTKPDVFTLLPHWGYASFRTAVADLLKHGYLTKDGDGRGVLHAYHVSTVAEPAEPAVIRLAEATVSDEPSWLVG